MSKVSPFRRPAGRVFGQRRAALPVIGAARRRGRSLLPEIIVALLAVGILGAVLIERGVETPRLTLPSVETSAPVTSDGSGEQVAARSFGLCGNSSGGSCVVDGDTIRLDGVSIRIADIDTPEVRGYACPEELARGQAATRRMLDLVNAGGFSMRLWDHRDADQYGRKLRVLEREGQSLGMMLVAEGLARPWDGARRSWCG